MNKKPTAEQLIGSRLRAARIAAGHTQKTATDALAERMGTELWPSKIAAYEQGRHMPKIDLLKELCNLYGADPVYILGITDAPFARDEKALLDNYRSTDERGKRAIQSIAEAQPRYGLGGDDENDQQKSA